MALNLMDVLKECGKCLENLELMILDQYNLAIENCVLKVLTLNCYLSEDLILFLMCSECYCVWSFVWNIMYHGRLWWSKV